MNKYKITALVVYLPIHFLMGYALNYSYSEFFFYKENGYDRVNAPSYVFVGEPGTPELPADYRNYIVPPDAKVESLIITDSMITEVQGSYLIYPTQPEHPSGESVPWVEPDTLIYNSDEPFPMNCIRVVGHGVMDGARIVTVEVHPLRWYPKSGKLYLVEDIGFEFSFSPADPPEAHPQIRGKYEQAICDAAMNDIVENDYQISAYYLRPTIVEAKTDLLYFVNFHA